MSANDDKSGERSPEVLSSSEALTDAAENVRYSKPPNREWARRLIQKREGTGEFIPENLWELAYPDEPYPLRLLFWGLRENPEEQRRAIEAYEKDSSLRKLEFEESRQRFLDEARQVVEALRSADEWISPEEWEEAYPGEEWPLEMRFWHLRDDPEAQQKAFAKYRELFPEGEDERLDDMLDEDW